MKMICIPDVARGDFQCIGLHRTGRESHWLVVECMDHTEKRNTSTMKNVTQLLQHKRRIGSCELCCI